jgi:5'(3')-deoxyribonucleotidase
MDAWAQRTGDKNIRFSGKVIDPALLAFDVDGVIADTMQLFLEIAAKDYRVSGLRYEDLTCYSLEECTSLTPGLIEEILARILEGDYAETLQPIDGAADVLNRLAGYRRPLLFVTARPHVGPIAQWLQNLVPEAADDMEVVATGTFEGKTAVLIENGIRYFVEDRLETCHRLKEVGIEPVLYRQPWNRAAHPFLEVGNWRELEALVAF